LAVLAVLLILAFVLYKAYKRFSRDVDVEEVKTYPFIKNIVTKIKHLSLKRKQAIIVIIPIIAFLRIWWPFSFMNIVSINAQRVILLSVAFILIGFVMNLINRKYFHFTKEYNAFAIFNMIILACGLFIPAFQGQLSLQRIYEVTFVVLSPFCIIGMYYIFTSAVALVKNVHLSKNIKISFWAMGIFLVLFFILNTGLIDLYAGQTSTLPLDNSIDAPIFSQGEYAGVAWFNENRHDNHTVYSDAFSNILLYWLNDIRTCNPHNMSEMAPGTYMFLRGYNIGHDTFLYGNGIYIPTKEGTNKSSKIYDNGDSQIYKRVLE